MWSEENSPKNREPHLVSPSPQCSSTPVGFGHGFLSKERCNNIEISPLLSWSGSSWFSSAPSTDISIEGTTLLWYYWHHWECDERAEKASTKSIPGMFQTPLQSLAEVYNFTRGILWRKCNLNVWTLLYFSEIKWSREHFEGTAYTHSRQTVKPGWYIQ
jgi:hypothetical protein